VRHGQASRSRGSAVGEVNGRPYFQLALIVASSEKM
jgi:hypothetical protein